MTSIADYFVIATCRSTRHANAIADELIKKLKKMVLCVPILKAAQSAIGL